MKTNVHVKKKLIVGILFSLSTLLSELTDVYLQHVSTILKKKMHSIYGCLSVAVSPSKRIVKNPFLNYHLLNFEILKMKKNLKYINKTSKFAFSSAFSSLFYFNFQLPSNS